ncbi:MAG: 4a-hydroxytetrahydrobiopterin dehydratase [Bacteroidia bacterium]
MELTEKKCVPCEGGVEKFTPDQIKEYKTEIDPHWKVEDNYKISRVFLFDDFAQAMAFANKVGDLAEEEGHHPDLHISWGRAEVELYTHAIGGLSENDFIMAAKIDELAL